MLTGYWHKKNAPILCPINPEALKQSRWWWFNVNVDTFQHDYPQLTWKKESNIVTADNYIIFNNLIIGQTANDHSADVNMLGRRIELQLIRLIMWCVTMCLYTTCKLFFWYWTTEREEAKGRERSSESECWEMRRKRWNVVSCAFCPPSTQEVNQCY